MDVIVKSYSLIDKIGALHKRVITVLASNFSNTSVVTFFQDSVFPADKGVNPSIGQAKPTSGHLARAGGFRMSNTFQAHSHSISG